MNVTGCIPLAGRGLVARRGCLVAVTDGAAAGPDPLLAVLAEVAAVNGDGTDLALAGTRAAVQSGGRPSWACAGVTFGGEVTVLVHGEAVVLVSVDGSQEAEVTATGSMIPVVRTFTGAIVAVRLLVDATAAPDPRLRLGEGTVSGGGIVLTVQETSQNLAQNDCRDPAISSAAPALRYDADDVFPPDPFAPPANPAAREQAEPYTESWFSADARPAAPTLRMTQTDGAGTGGLAEPLVADLSMMELVQLGAVEPVLIEGTMCERRHFNAPEAMVCRACGSSMHDATRNVRRQPRPPLGVLLVDDGRGYILDRDYVIGREPLLDGDVAEGRATALPMSDPEGSVSRLHLRISLVGWQVKVQDLGSSNGSVLHRSGGSRPLAPMDDAVLDPGARVGVGRRAVQFLPYGASPR
jgi:hypothetical protein